MKHSPFFCIAMLGLTAWSCGSNSPKQAVNEPTVSVIGYYADTLPCADCNGIYTQLELKNDSTFVLFETYVGKDTVAYCTLGFWAEIDGQVQLALDLQSEKVFKSTAEGLELLDIDKNEIESKYSYLLRRKNDSINYLKPFRVVGRYYYRDNLTTLTLCNIRKQFPVMPGLENSTAEKLFINNKGEVLFIEATITIENKPNLEGVVTNQVIIHKVIRKLDISNCP